MIHAISSIDDAAHVFPPLTTTPTATPPRNHPLQQNPPRNFSRVNVSRITPEHDNTAQTTSQHINEAQSPVSRRSARRNAIGNSPRPVILDHHGNPLINMPPLTGSAIESDDNLHQQTLPRCTGATQEADEAHRQPIFHRQLATANASVPEGHHYLTSRRHPAQGVTPQPREDAVDADPVKTRRHLPSGSGLPVCWNQDMDKHIAYLESRGQLNTPEITRNLKEKYSILRTVSCSVPQLFTQGPRLILAPACHHFR